ncbi:MAG: hypothetical protein SAJ12_00080 [Jaaginema sp. PMC 1079.18]|nr:hypothetical protein [Jaaginema sp. PMC 1080.18]MEC4849381.1 hypothetical protein [Jaaginema sp. PMC 1079.18]MEC4865414.1 hypothetical protein [Jaaginema sp. PMC 1078.18]
MTDNCIDQAITQYAQALSNIEPMAQPPLEPILDVLLVRDTIQGILEDAEAIASHQLSHIAKLDDRLHQFANRIALNPDVAQCRESRQPPQSAWWWYLEASPPPPPVQPWWAKHDWVWNVGTVACLVVSTTFLSQTVKAFSAAQGFDFLGVLSTIGQGTGLVLVAGGALTDRGKKVIEKGLTRFEFPSYLHAEITFLGALLVLGLSYTVNQNLHLIGELYYQQGLRQQTDNRWSEARDSYDRALNFIPDDPRIFVATGSIYEALGDFDAAIAQYEKGVLAGYPGAMNALARAMVWRDWARRDWQTAINEDIAQEAELLLERGSKLISQIEGNSDLTRLQAEIRINQGILDWARSGWKSENGLLDRTWLFDNAVALNEAIPEEDRFRYESWPFRGNCYSQLSLILRFAFEGTVAGIDPNLAYRQFDWACFDLLRGDRATLIYDSRVVSTAIDLAPVRAFFQNLQNQAQPSLIRDSRQIQQVQQQLENAIAANLDALFAIEETVILRVFVNEKGQVVQYYAYDEDSANLAYATPIDSLWWQYRNQDTTTTAPLADFRVTFSPDSTYSVTPWSQAVSDFERNNLSVIKSLLFEQLDQNTPRHFTLSGAWAMGDSTTFSPPLQYRVGLTTAGKIATIDSLTPEAETNFEVTPLASIERVEVTQQPLVNFIVEFRGSDVFQIVEVPARSQ